MTRRTEAPAGRECPHRHQCPHLDGLSTTWVMECYQEVFELREQLDAREQRYQQRIAELEKTLLERDAIIAQLRLQHQKQFKANKPKPDSSPIKVKVKRRGRRRAIPAGTAGNRTTSTRPCRFPPPRSAGTVKARSCSRIRRSTSTFRKTSCWSPEPAS